VVTPEPARSILTRNDSPDVPFDRSINPYRGCEHGCVYCFARPSHAYLNLSPGLDFETRIFSKPAAADLLRAELSRPGYRCEVVALGANTDPYQPVEKRLGITRSVLEVLAGCDHPVSIVTKSALVLRDADLLAGMAAKRLAMVLVSITTLDPELAGRMEPRAAAPARRLETVSTLAGRGIPVGVLASPMIPGLNDHELERILAAAAAAGAGWAGSLVVRLPHELAGLFFEWLEASYPARVSRVRNRIREVHGGRLYDPRFGVRTRGSGPYAAMLGRRHEVACRRLGLATRAEALDTSLFSPPRRDGGQRTLFRPEDERCRSKPVPLDRRRP